MGVDDLWAYVLEKCPESCRNVNLISVAKSVSDHSRRSAGSAYYPGQSPPPMRLVVDAHECLSRLYGGYYNDWICGGGWNRMTTFIQELTSALQQANITIVPVFNGAGQLSHIQDWHREQLEVKSRLTNIFRHLTNSAAGQWKPPPKVWWVAPSCMELSLRMAFRVLKMQTVCTAEDHAQEVIDFCRDHRFHGVVAESADYLIFQPPRLFSSMAMKLKYTGRIETIEFNIDLIARTLDVHPNRLPLFAALLGNHILTTNDLHEFHCLLLERDPLDTRQQFEPKAVIECILGFVRRLDNADPDNVGSIIFRNYATLLKADLIAKLKESVQYYVNGTQEGYEKYKPKLKSGAIHERFPGSYPAVANLRTNGTGDNTTSSLKIAPTITVVTDNNSQPGGKLDSLEDSFNLLSLSEGGTNSSGQQLKLPTTSGRHHNPPTTGSSTSSCSSSSIGNSPGRLTTVAEGASSSFPPAAGVSSSVGGGAGTVPFFTRHKVSQKIMREAGERHQKGLMHPWIYQVLAEGHAKMEVGLENEISYNLPLAVDLYRPIRRHVYGVLLNTHKHLASESLTKSDPGLIEKVVSINEWVVRKQGLQCEQVKAVGLTWETPEKKESEAVPSCQQLWFGQLEEHAGKRTRALLSCLGLSSATALFDTNRVSPYYLVLCCTLRYLITQRVLCYFELHAFLIQALHPDLHQVNKIMELKLPFINSRAVQLASLFMKGVEHVIFANDACGAPIPWNYTCPWNFFDGKLFQWSYQMIHKGEALAEVCGFKLQSMLDMEVLKAAILDGLSALEFAEPSVASLEPSHSLSSSSSRLNLDVNRSLGSVTSPGNKAGHSGPFPASQPNTGRGGGYYGNSGSGGDKQQLGGGSMSDYRGGKLEVGGIVVSNWGPNVQAAATGRGRGRGRGFASLPPGSESKVSPPGHFPAGMPFPGNPNNPNYRHHQNHPIGTTKSNKHSTGRGLRSSLPACAPSSTPIGQWQTSQSATAPGGRSQSGQSWWPPAPGAAGRGKRPYSMGGTVGRGSGVGPAPHFSSGPGSAGLDRVNKPKYPVGGMKKKKFGNDNHLHYGRQDARYNSVITE